MTAVTAVSARLGIDAAAELDQQRNAPEQAVGIRRRVEESRGAGRLCQHGKIADGAGRLEERLFGGIVLAHDREAERMRHARDWRVWDAVERHRVAEHHATGPQRLGQRLVGRGARAFVAVGFREDDVERDRGRAEIAKAGDQLADDVAAPRPLADRGQAAVVDVDDDDPAARRPGRRGAHERVVGAVFPVPQERRAVEREQGSDERGHQAAQHHEAAGPERHLIVISTRRLRGS